MRIAVIGAGLSGLAAACELADRGHTVEILERRPWAGGATYSFADPARGPDIDNGQHVFMRCTTAYRAFLRRLGTANLTWRQPRLRVPVFDARGRRSDIWAASLPAPFHLAPSFARYRHLSVSQKAAVARGVLAISRVDEGGRADLNAVGFGDWLRARGQSAETIRDFWDFFLTPTLNCGAERSSAGQALFVLQEGFLRDARASALGVPAVGLSELHVDPAVRYIEDRGGHVATRSAVTGFRTEGGRVTAVGLTGGEARSFDAYVAALPPWRLAPLIPEALREREPFAGLRRFESASILNLHVWFDRPVADFAFAAFAGSDLQWVFNRTRIGEEGEGQGQHLVVSVSDPGPLFDLDKAALERHFVPLLRAALPGAAAAAVTHFRAVKEPEATFVPSPGLSRPGPRTPLANLYLAGAYTDTGWPATMESAVRSGLAAAAALHGDAARGALRTQGTT